LPTGRADAGIPGALKRSILAIGNFGAVIPRSNPPIGHLATHGEIRLTGSHTAHSDDSLKSCAAPECGPKREGDVHEVFIVSSTPRFFRRHAPWKMLPITQSGESNRFVAPSLL
jgi:hypothetical protein